MAVFAQVYHLVKFAIIDSEVPSFSNTSVVDFVDMIVEHDLLALRV